MVQRPLKIIDDFASLNAYCMTFHLHIKDDLDEVINKCHNYGIKVGIALNPEEDINELEPYLDKIELVLIMSVHPGLPGQKFIPDVLPKIKKLRSKFKAEKRTILISVDGGVNLDNYQELSDVDIIVSGSCVTNSSNYVEVIDKLKG